jgi:HEAT repeat protein
MTKTKEKSQFGKLVHDLNASQDVIVMDTIDKIKHQGTPEIIPHVIALFEKKPSEEVVRKITGLLFSLKDEQVIPFLIEGMKNEKIGELYRSVVISSFWNSGLNPVDYLSDLINIAIQGSYLECIEVLTVIENLEPPYNEEQLMEALVDLRQFVNENKQDERIGLLNGMLMLLTVFNDK